MALSASIVWEVRSTATAGNTNGGGFKTGASGTDYSQQNGPQYALTGASTSGANAIVAHASAAADMIGNVCYVVSGTNFTAGWYEIIGVSVGVNFTCDRAVATGVGASGVINVGGAMSLNSALDTTFGASVVAGNTVWIKGNVTLGATFTMVGGAAGTNVTLAGYLTTRGDAPTAANRPLISCATFTFNPGGRTNVSHLRFIGTAANVLTTGQSTFMNNCKVTNNSTTASRVAINASSLGNVVLNCEGISYRGIACKAGNQGVIAGNYFHDSDKGIQVSTASPVAINFNVVESCVTSAVDYTGAASSGGIFLANNTFYGAENKTGIGINIAASAVSIWIYNNIFYGFTTAINDANGTGSNYADFNLVNNCTATYTGISTGSGGITLAPSFTTVTQITGATATVSGLVLTQSGASFTGVTDSQDFVYISSGTVTTTGQYMITGHTTTTLTLDISPGDSAVADKKFQITTGRNFAPGKNVRQVGMPHTFQAGLFTNYLDLGALQRDYNVEVPLTTQVKAGVSYASGDFTGTLIGGHGNLGKTRMG